MLWITQNLKTKLVRRFRMDDCIGKYLAKDMRIDVQ